MTSFQVLLVLACLAGLGGVVLARAYYHIRKRRRFAADVYERFQQAAAARQQGEVDDEAVTWLTYHADRMQRYLVEQGIVTYAPSMADYPGVTLEDDATLQQGQALLLDALPQLRAPHADARGLDRVDELLVRYLGATEEEQRQRGWRLLNPLLWLREGIRAVLLSPIYLLHGFDLVRATTVRRIGEAVLVKLLVLIVYLVVVLGAAAIVVFGWEQVIAVMQEASAWIR
ncbi:MAG: hypothetical protein GVY18_12145 [Bacteroidetes bacterium]|jgi:hypothetical protein|nr:hypothetical protein [Bacteroidota bacterium]